MKAPLSSRIGNTLFSSFLKQRGIEIVHAQSSKHKADAYQLRAEIFQNEQLSSDSNQYPDRYDGHADIFVAYKNGEAVGTLRTIQLGPGCKTLDYVNVEIPKDIQVNQIRELGSLVVKRKYRGKGREIFYGLCNAAYFYSLEHEVQWWLATSRAKEMKSFTGISDSYLELKQKELSSAHVKNRQAARL